MIDTIPCYKRITNYCLLILIFLLPVIVMPSLNDAFALPKASLLKTISLLLIILFILRLGKSPSGIHINSNSLNLPVLLFFAAAVISTMFSVDSKLSIYGMYKYYFNGLLSIGCYIVIYFAVVVDVEKKDAGKLLTAIIAGAMPVVLYALIQYSGHDFVRWAASSNSRVWSTMGNPNFLGSYLIMVMPVCMAVFLTTKKVLNKLYLFIVFVLLLFVLVFTKSRASWIGFLFSMIVFALLTDKKTIRENAIWLKYLLIVLMLITAALFVFNSNGLYSVAERFSSIFNISEMDIASRLEGYKVAVKIIKENVILGSGMDSFSVKFRQYMPVSFRQYGGMLAHPGYAHNELLQTALDAGLLGLGIYLWLLIAFFNKTLKTIKTTAGQAKILLAGVLCSVAALLIQNQFSFNTITTAAYFWIFIGITVVISPVGEKTNLIKGKTLPQVMVYLIAIVIGAYSAPGIMKPVLADSFFTGADTCMKNGMPEEAVVLYTKAVKYNPGEAFYRMNLAKACKLISDGKVVLYEKKSYLNKAIVEYENQLNRQPYNALAWNGIGVCCFSLSKLENDTGLLGKSIDLLKRAIELDPNLVEACINLAFAYEKLEMYDDAVKSYNDVLRIDPQNDSAHFNLGCIYGNKKLFNKAVFHWQEALKSDPKNLKAKTYLEAVKYSVKQ